MEAPWCQSRLTGAALLAALALVACSKSPTSPAAGPSGTFRGTLVGPGVSGVLTLTLPAAATAMATAPAFGASAALGDPPISGTLTLTGGGSIALAGSYDPSASPQLSVSGSGYAITGNYAASSNTFSGAFTGPSGSGKWTTSGGSNTKVFCGTYIGSASGTWNLVLDGSNLTGVAYTSNGALELQGSYSSSDNSISLTFSNGGATGTLNPTNGTGGGSWHAGSSEMGTWSAGSC